MPVPEPGESSERQSFQRMTRGSITACASLIGAARLLATSALLEKVVGDESAVTATVLTKERSRNLIHQKQRIWTIFRRTKDDSLWRLRLSSVLAPGRDRKGRFTPCSARGQWTDPWGSVRLSSLCQSEQGPIPRVSIDLRPAADR